MMQGIVVQRLAGIVLVVAACSSAKPVQDQPQERRAIVRIDAQPAGTKFQGVWLEQVDGTKWLIDSQPSVWMFFRDREVFVSGACYQPGGDAIRATHFRVDRLRDARPVRGERPYLAIGPEVVLSGVIEAHDGPPGSKAALVDQLVFRADDGVVYNVVGESAHGHVRVRGRALEPDMSYAARTGERDFWIAAVLEPATAREIPCH